MRRTSRRDFLSKSAVSFGSLPLVRLTGPWQAAPNLTAAFQHGVASGDPLSDRVLLWTRVTPLGAQAADVRWTVATDPMFKHVVARGEGQTGAWRDYTVKVDVGGLQPATTYYYRFESRGQRSAVGRTRTLPAPNARVSRLRFGVVSCSNYAFGYFNAYGALAARPDLDAVIHLGDYLYEHANAQYGDGTKLGRIPAPNAEIVSLADYRQRHAQYKTDPDSQAIHQQHPFIVVWDDHELANNTWMNGAQNHNPDRGEGEWLIRKKAAIQAFFEWMPIREELSLTPRIYRTLRFGDLVDLIMLDTRVVGRDEQTGRDDLKAIESPERSVLGAEQEAWLHGQFVESRRAGTAWQILGQQIMFAPMTPPGQRVGNTDVWEGYRASRGRVFDMIESTGAESVAVLTGDVHSSWAWDLPRRPYDRYDPATGRDSLGIEFAGTSVTSPSSLGSGENGEKQLADTKAARPHLKYVDGRYRGYFIVDVNPERLQADYFAVRTIEERTRDERFVTAYAAPAREMHLTVQASPSPPRAGAPDPAP
jgi:alkaline phosphatase D